ncbi:hypothetical protein AALP_AA1G326800 [Arabis alpina]|uniref:C2H2-type domain-containing protein n=1 Tax=Arabis alpina TaxID=50452 RepID=A0A087HS65_ARAAL|nr:hypothetical protein AALP_AA1G326800 [Arabis alpina]
MEIPAFNDASLKHPKGKELFERAKSFYAKQDYINALKEIEDLSLVKLNDDGDKATVNLLQGAIFRVLSENTDNTDVKYTYLLGSVESFWMHHASSGIAALSFFELAEHLGSVFYYKRALAKAKRSGDAVKELEGFKDIIETAELKIAESKTGVASTVKKCEERVIESKEKEETRKIDFDLVKRLKLYWDDMDVEIRRNFLKVSVAEFKSFVKRLYDTEGLGPIDQKKGLGRLEQVLASAKQDRKWMFWMCRTCAKKFSSADECKNHFEQEHGAKLQLNPGNGVVEMISETLAQKISVGGWEPVDAVAAVEMIKNQLKNVEAFAYENGWSKHWPLAADEERRELLHEIHLLLVSFYDRKVFSSRIQDWLMDVVVKYFETLEVSKDILTKCLLLETPQSICFLECVELNQILDFLKTIKCERDDGTDLVCRAVDSFCGGTRVKEKIDFDHKFSFLLLDKELLQGKIPQLDDEGTINVVNPNAHYAKANGDYILSCSRVGLWEPNIKRNSSDDSVLSSIAHLKTLFTYKISYKVPRMDTKILLIEQSRINLLNQLIKLSVVDYRSYILGPLKKFLLQGILDMGSKAKAAAENAALLLEEEEKEKTPQSKKKNKNKNKVQQKTAASISSPLDTIVEHEPEITVSSERDQLEISSNTDKQDEERHAWGKSTKADPGCERASQLTDMPGENSLSKHLESAHGAAATRCNSALEMTLRALCNIEVLKDYLVQNKDEFPDKIQEQVSFAIRNYFAAFASEAIKEKGFHSYLVENILDCLEPRDAAGVLVSILEFWPCWKNPEIESVVTRLFTLGEYERMSCQCGKKPNYQEQSSYGMVMAADSIRDLKCAFGNIKFDDILKMTRMEDKMLCECGKANFVHRSMSTCPFIFTIVLKWVKDETEEESSDTTKALDSEIDISKLYEGVKPNTIYQLVSMVCYGEEEGYNCLAYKMNQWFSLKDEALLEEGLVGDWEDVVRFCKERKVRPEILFYEDPEGKELFERAKSFYAQQDYINALKEIEDLSFVNLNDVDEGNRVVEMISEARAQKISVGGWEPVDAEASAKMIKNQLEEVKAFAYENGWSQDWPLATDEERSKLLHEIQELLVSLYEHKVLPGSILGWIMDFVVKHLENFGVPEHILTECLLLETPQNLVCRAVDSFCGGTRVKEKIDFDRKFSILLLDKRLLQGKIAQLDDEGTCNVLNPNAHYTKERAHGDYILSWTLGAKYRKKLMVLCFDASLDEVKKLCILEDERRRNIPEDQRTSYATLICDKYEKLTARDSLAARVDLSVARQVLEAASVPTFDCPDSEDSLNVIREHRTATDDSVLISIENLKLVVNNKIFYKVPRMDTKILLIEKSRINLLNQLIKLSVVDYRSYILGPLKNFLLQGILDIESKAKTAAENAALLLKEEEEEKKPPSKKKKNKRNKKNSTSISSPLDTIVEREPEDTVSSERDQLKVSSNTNNQEKVAKGDPGCEKASQLTDMPGENSRSKHLESAHGAAATRCDSALEMTLKALCNIKVLKEYLVQNKDQFPDDLQEQVPSLIQGYFVAFASEQIEQVHSYFVENLLACLEPREAAGVLLSILEFWPCWKNPEIESVVTHLFTLDEYETMSCCKCGKNPNYPEQSSYGMVMAADSIRELKCDFENMKFYDILKMTRMEDKMLCECGKANFVHRIMTTCPFIFTIVLEWVKDETAEEISETAKALDREIDISKIYEGLKPNTKYRLVSMVGYGEEEGYICLACKTNKWFCLKEGVGDWKDVVRFCVDRKVRPEILFYEAVWSMA